MFSLGNCSPNHSFSRVLQTNNSQALIFRPYLSDHLGTSLSNTSGHVRTQVSRNPIVPRRQTHHLLSVCCSCLPVCWSTSVHQMLRAEGLLETLVISQYPFSFHPNSLTGIWLSCQCWALSLTSSHSPFDSFPHVFQGINASPAPRPSSKLLPLSDVSSPDPQSQGLPGLGSANGWLLFVQP